MPIGSALSVNSFKRPVTTFRQYHDPVARGVFKVKVGRYIGSTAFKQLMQNCNVSMTLADISAKTALDGIDVKDIRAINAGDLVGSIIGQSDLKAIIIYPERQFARPRSVFFVGDSANFSLLPKDADICAFNSPFEPGLTHDKSFQVNRAEAEVLEYLNGLHDQADNVTIMLKELFEKIHG